MIQYAIKAKILWLEIFFYSIYNDQVIEIMSCCEFCKVDMKSFNNLDKYFHFLRHYRVRVRNNFHEQNTDDHAGDCCKSCWSQYMGEMMSQCHWCHEHDSQVTTPVSWSLCTQSTQSDLLKEIWQASSTVAIKLLINKQYKHTSYHFFYVKSFQYIIILLSL